MKTRTRQKCPVPSCPGHLRTYHTYAVGVKRFVERVCARCGWVGVFVTTTAKHEGPESAYELAKRERGGQPTDR